MQTTFKTNKHKKTVENRQTISLVTQPLWTVKTNLEINWNWHINRTNMYTYIFRNSKHHNFLYNCTCPCWWWNWFDACFDFSTRLSFKYQQLLNVWYLSRECVCESLVRHMTNIFFREDCLSLCLSVYVLHMDFEVVVPCELLVAQGAFSHRSVWVMGQFVSDQHLLQTEGQVTHLLIHKQWFLIYCTLSSVLVQCAGTTDFCISVAL